MRLFVQQVCPHYYFDFPPEVLQHTRGFLSIMKRIMLFRQHREGPERRSHILIVVCFFPFLACTRPPEHCIYRPNPPNYIRRHKLMPTWRVQDAVLPNCFHRRWCERFRIRLVNANALQLRVWHCNFVWMGENTSMMHAQAARRPVNTIYYLSNLIIYAIPVSI